MKKKVILFFILLFVTVCFSGCSNNEEAPTSENSSLDINRTSREENVVLENISLKNNVSSVNTSTQNSSSKTSSEKVLAEFSTRIYSKDSARQNNLEITSKALNGTIVKANETFSFTKTIGPSTSQKGYEEADVFDSNGNKIKGYGGGNCQVSSTLYNAVQKVPSLKIVERHEHSNTVPYVKEGHDAAVAYGSVDFKFKNTNNYSIKIVVETSNKYVKVKLLRI